MDEIDIQAIEVAEAVDFLAEMGLKVPAGFVVDRTGTYMQGKFNDDGSRTMVTVANAPVWISGKLVDIDNDNVHLQISWVQQGKPRKLVVGRGVVMNARKIVDLADKG